MSTKLTSNEKQYVPNNPIASNVEAGKRFWEAAVLRHQVEVGRELDPSRSELIKAALKECIEFTMTEMSRERSEEAWKRLATSLRRVQSRVEMYARRCKRDDFSTLA